MSDSNPNAAPVKETRAVAEPSFQKSHPQLAAAAPIICGAIVYLTYRAFFSAAKIHRIEPGFGPDDLHLARGIALADIQSATASLAWSVTGVFFILALIASLTVLLPIMASTFRKRPMATQVSIFLIGIVSGGGFALASLRDNVFTTKSLNPIVERSFELLSIDCAKEFFMAFTGIMVFIAFLLAIATSMLMAERARKEESSANHLRRQGRRLNAALFIGATMIVAGIVHAIAVHKIPGALLDQAQADELLSLVHVLSTSLGAIWTFILLGIFIPAFIFLRHWTHELALLTLKKDASPEDLAEWLTERGLSFTPYQQVARVVALLAPLLVGGPAGPLLQLVTG